MLAPPLSVWFSWSIFQTSLQDMQGPSISNNEPMGIAGMVDWCPSCHPTNGVNAAKGQLNDVSNINIMKNMTTTT